jgi:hypothetical protein
MKQKIGQHLVRWCVCIRTGNKKDPWGIYHDGDKTPVPLIFGTKREASEKARSLSREQDPHRTWRYRAGRFFYSGEISLKPRQTKV